MAGECPSACARNAGQDRRVGWCHRTIRRPWSWFQAFPKDTLPGQTAGSIRGYLFFALPDEWFQFFVA